MNNKSQQGFVFGQFESFEKSPFGINPIQMSAGNGEAE